MATTSFSTQGATPSGFGQGLSVNSSGNLVSSTPVANALNAAQSSKPAVSYTAPSTPVKSQTTAADGSVTQTYHPPATSTTSTAPTNTSAQVYNPTTGTWGGYIAPTPPANAPAPNTGTQQNTPSGNGTPGVAGFIDAAPASGSAPAVANPTGTLTTGNSTTAAYSPSNTPQQVSANISPSGMLQTQIGESQATLQQQQQNAQDIITSNTQTLNSAQQELEELTGGSYSGTSVDYSGRAAQLANLIQSSQANINAANQNLTAYSTQAQSALAGGVSATSQLQSSPYGQPLINPVSGQSYSGGQNTTSGMLGGGGSTSIPTGGIQPNDLIYPQVQYWAQLVANGSVKANDLPTPFNNGVVQTQIQQMALQINPYYNPLTTPLNTQTQANTNASIGATNSTAGAATTQAISRIGNITSNIDSFLTQWGLNQSSSPFFNQPVNTFLGSSQGAGAETSWKLITADLTAATSQLMSTPGITPSGFTSELSSFDPTNLSPSEMSTYLQSLAAAGQYQLSSYQTTATSAYGSNAPTNSASPVTPYEGTPTASAPPPLPTPANPVQAQAANAPSFGKVLGGAVLDVLGTLGGFAASLFAAL